MAVWSAIRRLRAEHPIFFWGMSSLAGLLLLLTLAVAIRIPQYARQMALMESQLDAEERETRDRILSSQTRRTALALALLRRELRLKSLEEDGVHLAINTEDSTLALRHGPATLREIPIAIGGDSIIEAPDGRTWRFVRALGERYVVAKERTPTVTVPEWVYVSRGEPVPPEEERTLEGVAGEYVLRLDDGTEIYSRPETGPFASGVKPGAFMADADGLEAIFEALALETPVYIY
ncbi:MAG TPA: hypothetical protein VF167_10555 [Longimicrobiaceae bacterium]